MIVIVMTLHENEEKGNIAKQAACENISGNYQKQPIKGDLENFIYSNYCKF